MHIGRRCQTVTFFLPFVCLVLLVSNAISWAQDNQTCLACHAEEAAGIPFVQTDEFTASVHGKLLCSSCHNEAKHLPHPDKMASVVCGACHRVETSIYENSDHGRALSKGITEAATCTSCHGVAHGMLSSRNPASPANRRNIPSTCGNCHADAEKMSRFRLSEQEPVKTYWLSIHGQALKEGELSSAVCSDCHGTHDLQASSNPESRMYRGNISKSCGRCHINVSEVFGRSIHGKASSAGIKEAPVCTDCHGEHTIRATKDPASTVYVGAITKTCSQCHESEKIIAKFGLPGNRLKTYQESYHGLAAKGGDLRVANCASCHGWHDILPSYDAESSVNKKNLRFTCGKCHPGAEARRIEGLIHGGGVTGGPLAIRLAKIFYLILIPVLIGAMLIHNLSDYLRKALASGPRTCISDEEEKARTLRLTVNERIQHAVLMTAFGVLAYTGFALEYPDAWWASPFNMTGGEALRKSIHRWTAFCLVSLGIYHLIYMLGTRRGRELLRRHFCPRRRDMVDPVRKLAYNFGFSKSKPELPYPSYVERIEYLSLIWGSIVMATTGSLLVFSDFTLKHFPLWVADLAGLIHFYEAVLACLAIAVWHLYWVIFDPEVYPMNWAWITGTLRRISGRPEEK